MTQLFQNLFVFEMANNHQGDVAHGLKIVAAMGRIARRHSIKAGVKLQYRDLDTLIHPDYRHRTDQPHIPRFIDTRLNDRELLTLIASIREQGMMTICTPFDEASVRRCTDHDIEIIKVGSCSALDWPLLEAIAATHKPAIISTAGLSIGDIDRIVSFFAHRNIDFALMHCVGRYPSPIQDLHLNFLGKMIRRYPGTAVGYSGHEDPDNTDVVKIAVGKGASILERHVGLATGPIKLNRYSMTPEQTDAWVTAALTAREICGDGDEKKISQAESESLRSLKRGVYAAREIGCGDLIRRDDVFFAMPCGDSQTTSGEFGQYRATFFASRDYEQSEAICESRELDLITLTREIVHEAKGMIHEANIPLNNDASIELSHHYGLKHFRETGSVFVDIIDRDYCKKLVVVLAGQTHPTHLHRIKEETFHLLWGDLEVALNGSRMKLKPGDKVLIRPGSLHSFSSQTGAVFEEISTRGIRGDSHYEDERIRILDPMERKTILESW